MSIKIKGNPASSTIVPLVAQAALHTPAWKNTSKRSRFILFMFKLSVFLLKFINPPPQLISLPASPAAIDCVVGSWGPWSSCTSPCGVGSTERSRLVSIPPRNGGTPCPDLKQRRGCFGNNAICSTAKGEHPACTPVCMLIWCSSIQWGVSCLHFLFGMSPYLQLFY